MLLQIQETFMKQAVDHTAYLISAYRQILDTNNLFSRELDRLERNYAMKIMQELQKMKQSSIDYRKDMEEHNRITQQVFSACLFFFIVLHVIIIHLVNFQRHEQFYAALWLSALQIAASLTFFFLFKNYFSSHKKYLLLAGYLNIFQTILLLELQYYLYDEYISYTIIVGIVLCTALSIIGHVRWYSLILLIGLSTDITITIMKNPSFIHSHEITMYILDNIFIFIIAVGMNYSATCLKYHDFAAKREILFLSERDSLTGLLNRKSLESAVERYTQSNGLCAMILLDLDNFKALNDTLGHYAGDDCLRATAEELTKVFRSTDYVSRLGGDEFTIFLPDIQNTAFVKDRANILLKKIPRSYTYQDGEIKVTCSVGIAFLSTNQDDLYESLYKAADSAMYVSKESGKNMVTVFANEFAEA